MIYLDNAATSYPKPIEVIDAINKSFVNYCANPGRSGHDMSINTAMAVYSARETLDHFFDGYGSEFVSFTSNCTEALNVAIKGMVNAGDHIVISSLEHNSVLRPVVRLSEIAGVSYSIFVVSKNEEETLFNLKKAINKKTKLIIITSVSNVFGNILPIKQIGDIAKENKILLLVDGAQGAGIIPIKMKEMGINCLCVPGHKSLFGPMGIGAVLHDGSVKSTIIEGGTGTESFNYNQPDTYPEKLESGTLNVPGICGLKKGVEIISSYGVNNIFKEETLLTKYLFNELSSMRNIILYRNEYDEKSFAPLVAFNVKNKHSEEVSFLLNHNGVAVRGGFHCAPLAHKAYGTEDVGAVRVSPSRFTTKKDVNYLINLLQKIAKIKNV
ncbi:MAG: aminotransferase class V-fold PLP-dependent enzyme [Clostridia bacterium]|nr:aminotransferase class V-fold PLP-dependent enzyme [Clostridia bacterium]